MDHGYLPPPPCPPGRRHVRVSRPGEAGGQSLLILGGTREARELAAALVRRDVPVISSLAGRVARPRLPEGDVRIGGFGGPDRLAEWLMARRIGAVVDATHPFARRISASAAQACRSTDTPLIRLERPGWTPVPGDDWHWVDSVDAAAARARAMGRRVFLTSGRQGLGTFAHDQDTWFLIRCVDPPSPPLPPRHHIILERGPYHLAGELALMDEHRIDVLVTKDSGGDLTRPKLDAARLRGLPVVIVRRPAPAGATAAGTVRDVLAWLDEVGYPG